MGARAEEHHPLLRTIEVGGRGGCRKNGSVGIFGHENPFLSLSRSFLYVVWCGGIRILIYAVGKGARYC